MRTTARAVLPTRQTVGTPPHAEISPGIYYFFFCYIITNCFRFRSGGGSALQRGGVISTDRLVRGGLCPGCLACPRERAGPNPGSGRPYDRDALPRMARRFLLSSRLSPVAHRQPHRCQPRCEPAPLQVVTANWPKCSPRAAWSVFASSSENWPQILKNRFSMPSLGYRAGLQ